MLQNGTPRYLRMLTAAALTGILAGCAGEPASRSGPAADGQDAKQEASAPNEASASDAAVWPEDQAGRYNSVMRLARLSDNSKDLSIAIGLYQRAHEIDPTQVDPLLRLATLYQETGFMDQAVEAYRRLVLIEPVSPVHLTQYGMLLLRADKPTEAQGQFLKALEFEESARTLNAAGVTYDMTGKRENAQLYYRTALKLDPSYLPAMGNLGLSLALSGKHRAGIEVLEEAVAMSKSGPEHRQMLATAYGLSGNMAAASQVSGKDFDDVALRENLKKYGVAD
jgi:Flp pilus assembly protein TadD